MISVIKLKVNRLTFEVGKDKVKSKDLDQETALVEIKFEEGSEWQKRVISIHNVCSIDFNEEHVNFDMNFAPG